jgi:hypothetical protein
MLDDRGDVVAVVHAGEPGRRMSLGVALRRVLAFVDPPEIVADPVLVTEDDPHAPADVRFRLSFPRPPAPEEVSVSLVLRPPGAPPRRLRLEKRGDGSYGTSTTIFPRPSDPGPGRPPGGPAAEVPFTLVAAAPRREPARLDGGIPLLSLARGLLVDLPFSAATGAAGPPAEIPGKLEGSPKRAPGPRGEALELDGKDDCIVLAAGPEPRPLRALTLALWIRTSQRGTPESWGAPAVAAGRAPHGEDLWGWLDETGRICVQRAVPFAARSLEPVNDGRWHHVAMTADAGSGLVVVYVDGARNESTVSGGGGAVAPIACIGRTGSRGGEPPVYLKAHVDEVRVYDRALHPGEVLLLSRTRKPKD